ncbi:unnamed protein product [Pylaiella littoralis]
MAGPRSLSTTTKVAAPGGASGKGVKGRRSKKHQNKSNKKQAPLATWDHDNSSADESVDGEATSASAAPAAATTAGKKRPRVVGAASGAAGDATQVPGDQGDGARKSSKKQGAAADGSSGASGGEDAETSSGSDGEEDGVREGRDGGDQQGAEGAAAASTGGMGDVMARILSQKLDSRVQAPVLAKRKTKAMKEMENASAKRAESRGKSAVRRANMTQQFVIPDHTTTDYERQLKKIATRGVVALFNAISKRQNQGDGSGGGGGGSGSGNNVARTAKATAVKGASRHAFLDMLKTGVKPVGGAAAVAAGGAGGKQASERGQGGAGAGADAGRAEKEGRSWSVLKEDYMMGASSMKNWDQESLESEEDALGGPNDMSDDDSD